MSPWPSLGPLRTRAHCTRGIKSTKKQGSFFLIAFKLFLQTRQGYFYSPSWEGNNDTVRLIMKYTYVYTFDSPFYYKVVNLGLHIKTHLDCEALC